MEQSPDLFKAIWVSHAVIILVQFLARYYTSLPKSGGFGIYILLLPIGFNVFGAGFSPWFIAAGAMLGLSIILFSLRRVRSENHEKPAATCSVPPKGDT